MMKISHYFLSATLTVDMVGWESSNDENQSEDEQTLPLPLPLRIDQFEFLFLEYLTSFTKPVVVYR